MDGARIFNACVAHNVQPSEYGQYCDSLCFSFTKGLGAPFGSMLLGEKTFIDRAAKIRKCYGGAMHQSGIMAAAALFAIKNNVDRLTIDHDNAVLFAKILSEDSRIIADEENVETNIVMIDISQLPISTDEFITRAKMENILLYKWNDEIIRAVTHLNVNSEDIIGTGNLIKKIFSQI